MKIKEYLNVLKISFHVIAISETWFDENTDLNDFHLNNYEIVHTDRLNKRGGGVLLYVNKQINLKKNSKFSIVEDDMSESVTVEIEIKKS